MRSSLVDRTRRAWTAVLVLALLLGQLGAFFHHSTERHEVCEEHGELVHASALTGEEDAEPATEGPLARGSGDDELDEHGHCELTLAQRSELTPVTSPVGLAPRIVAPDPTPVPEHADAHGVPLILEAPKQSPPV